MGCFKSKPKSTEAKAPETPQDSEQADTPAEALDNPTPDPTETIKDRKQVYGGEEE